MYSATGGDNATTLSSVTLHFRSSVYKALMSHGARTTGRLCLKVHELIICGSQLDSDNLWPGSCVRKRLEYAGVKVPSVTNGNVDKVVRTCHNLTPKAHQPELRGAHGPHFVKNSLLDAIA